MAQTEHNAYSFPQKVWIAGGITALLLCLLLLFRSAFSVLLLVLAGTLIALLFLGIADLIQKKTKWPHWLCMTISVVGILLILGSLSWFIGYRVQLEAAQLTKELPATWQAAKEKLNQSPLGQELLSRAQSDKMEQKARGVFSRFFKSTFGILGDVYVILFLGIFFMAAPDLYRKGIIRLVPPKGREKATHLLTQTASHLKKWLAGKFFAMFVVFVLTATGLLILGFKMWLVLAIIAGLLNFIPNFGPIIALIPAALLGMMQGTDTVLIVAGMYIVIQVLESNAITPMVQQKLVSVPPALIIITQLVVGAFSGFWGLLLATPLLLIVMGLVKEIYLPAIEKNDAVRKA